MIPIQRVKEWLDVQDTDESDQLFRSLERRAVDFFESNLGETLNGLQTKVEIMTPIGIDFVRVSSMIRTLTVVEIMGWDAVWTAQDLTTYGFSDYAVYPLPTAANAFDPGQFNSVRLTYDTGFDENEVPGELEAALLELIEHTYRNRLTTTPGAEVQEFAIEIPGAVQLFLRNRRRLAGT